MVQRAAFQWLNRADLDKDGYWHHYYNILVRKDITLANRFLFDITLLKWQDDVDGLVLRATRFQETLHEPSPQVRHTPASERPVTAVEQTENQRTRVGSQQKCDCVIGDNAAAQIRSSFISGNPDAGTETGQMSDLTLSQFSRSDLIGVDRRSLFEIYTELWRAWEESSTFQAESKGRKRMSVCIGADLALNRLGDIDFKIKVERSRGLDMASKFRIPIRTSTQPLNIRSWESTLVQTCWNPLTRFRGYRLWLSRITTGSKIIGTFIFTSKLFMSLKFTHFNYLLGKGDHYILAWPPLPFLFPDIHLMVSSHCGQNEGFGLHSPALGLVKDICWGGVLKPAASLILVYEISDIALTYFGTGAFQRHPGWLAI
ncbi:hypothetical protein QBC36DRAFT_370731 [Triangularia setosa]|uniref:Uncharacterized protein n=1 Tax=Triangularia setosa TaxID=2587417 RepID=A0AAN6VWJ0_9PEZI|nr:hypothetical protein QBC36DRAFT_370731 [Podospora setosa]